MSRWVPSSNQQELMDLLEGAPLPWIRVMVRDWFGMTDSRVSNFLIAATARGFIERLGTGVYTAKGRVPPKLPPQGSLDATPSRLPNQLITDDVLAKYGFNL